MLAYIILGACLGVFIGYIVPPGAFFWFVIGAVSGFFVNRCWGRKC